VPVVRLECLRLISNFLNRQFAWHLMRPFTKFVFSYLVLVGVVVWFVPDAVKIGLVSFQLAGVLVMHRLIKQGRWFVD
jgi:hypothetical protein